MKISNLLHRMRYCNRFESQDREASYRRACLSTDISRTRILIILTFIPTLVFIASDYYHEGTSTFFYTLLGLRLFAFATSLTTFLLLRRPISVRGFDILTSSWILILISILLFITFSRPSTFTTHSMFNIMVILGIYLTLPIPFIIQVVCAVLITTSEAILFTFVKEPQTTAALLNVMVTYIVTNAVGIITSLNFAHTKRAQFLSLESEKEATESLNKALNEIKTLRGLILICQECNRVLDDDGHWEQVEAYVRNHTHAEFAHGICLDCAETRHAKPSTEPQRNT